MTTESTRHRAGSPIGRLARQRWVPFAAAATAAALTAGAIATAGGGAAGAATAPQAQSAGNFLDATLGGNPIDQIAALKYARAQAPGANGVQNPLDVTVLNAINLPLTGVVQLPTFLGINLGAANQVAKANVNGSSYGAAGAVNNSGGVSVGGDNNAFPSNATINLSGSGIAGSAGAAADALGSIKVNLGAVSAVAQTPIGYAKAGTTQYKIADVNLQLASPLLGSLLATVGNTLNTVLGTLNGLANGLGLPPACNITTGLGSGISLEGGAITLDATTGSLTISLDKLLKQLGLDLNALPANTDLISLLVNYLTSPNGLAKAIQGVIDGLTDPLSAKFLACTTALNNNGPIGQVLGLLGQLVTALNAGKTQLETAINGLVTQLGAAAGANPLAPLGDVLKKVVDIGVNVQPLVKSGDFTDKLADHTVKQNQTPPPAVPYSTLVRAIEVNVLPTNNADGLLSLALANAAAGPSTAPAAPSTTPAPPTTAPPTNVPTGVPAGAGTHGGSPVLPLTLLLLGLMFAGGGAFAYRYRGTLNQH